MAFSPLARGVLTSTPPRMADLRPRDIRHAMPRFAAANYPDNLVLRGQVEALALGAGCSVAQLALAWVLSRGPHVLAIPGTRSVEHLLEDLGALGLALPAAVLDAAGRVLGADTVRGPRYAATTQAEIDTEAFPDAG